MNFFLTALNVSKIMNHLVFGEGYLNKDKL
jgi:hypothetical protein